MATHLRFLKAVTVVVEKSQGRRRRDGGAAAMLPHRMAVARLLAEEGRVTDEDLLLAAVLHDTIAPCEQALAELEGPFGRTVTAILREFLSSGPRVPGERQRRGEEPEPYLESRVRQLRMADKICRIRQVMSNPPVHWPQELKRDYLQWTVEAVADCRGGNRLLDQALDETLQAAARQLGVPWTEEAAAAAAPAGTSGRAWPGFTPPAPRSTAPPPRYAGENPAQQVRKSS